MIATFTALGERRTSLTSVGFGETLSDFQIKTHKDLKHMRWDYTFHSISRKCSKYARMQENAFEHVLESKDEAKRHCISYVDFYEEQLR